MNEKYQCDLSSWWVRIVINIVGLGLGLIIGYKTCPHEYSAVVRQAYNIRLTYMNLMCLSNWSECNNWPSLHCLYPNMLISIIVLVRFQSKCRFSISMWLPLSAYTTIQLQVNTIRLSNRWPVTIIAVKNLLFTSYTPSLYESNSIYLRLHIVYQVTYNLRGSSNMKLSANELGLSLLF